MPRAMLVWGTLGAVMVAQPARTGAQVVDMGNGIWHGWLMQTGQDSIPVSYAVSHAGKHLLITLRGRSGIIYDMSDAKVKNDVLTFDWPMGLGSSLYCRLTRRDGKSFEGTCNDRSPGQTGRGIRVWMLITPPTARDSTAPL